MAHSAPALISKHGGNLQLIEECLQRGFLEFKESLFIRRARPPPNPSTALDE